MRHLKQRFLLVSDVPWGTQASLAIWNIHSVLVSIQPVFLGLQVPPISSTIFKFSDFSYSSLCVSISFQIACSIFLGSRFRAPVMQQLILPLGFLWYWERLMVGIVTEHARSVGPLWLASFSLKQNNCEVFQGDQSPTLNSYFQSWGG